MNEPTTKHFQLAILILIHASALQLPLPLRLVCRVFRSFDLASATVKSEIQNLAPKSMPQIRNQSSFRGRPLENWLTVLGFLLAFGFQISPLAQGVPAGFIAETVATNLNAATAMTIAPDGRVFIADQTGPLRIWKDGRLLAKPALDLSDKVDSYWERGLIGVTLHPDFPRSPYLFVVYVAKSPYTHHVVSRFTIVGDTVDPASERILIEGDDQSKLGGTVPAGHQGGIIRMGPDGKVYFGLGEQTAGTPSQSLNTLQGKILRINQDGTIPEDNPFYNKTTGKYRAIWAYGIRNPFGLGFEPDTGRLFETEVGQSSFEEVNIIVKGGNYGWPDAEGMSTNAAFINPIHTYPPTIGRSIVSGLFYPSEAGRGSRPADVSSDPNSDSSSAGASPYLFPEKWRGRFFFADWADNWIKTLDPKNPTDVNTFARNLNQPVALATAPDGSLFALNRGTIWRDGKKFVANSGSLVRIRYVANKTPGGITENAEAIPQTLAKTHLFTSLNPLKPNPEFHEFEINLPPWQPGVTSRRWISIPRGRKIHFEPHGEWGFPDGTIVIQNFEESDGPQAGLSFETHVMWFTGPRTVRAAAYRWRGDESGAELGEESAVIPLPGQPMRNWFSPGAEQNVNVDTVVVGFRLPINTRQLNREIKDQRTGKPVNQLLQWFDRGWFDAKFAPGAIGTFPKLVRLEDSYASLEQRVRSYLDVNCSVCHRPGGLSRGQFDARFTTPLADQNIIDGQLIAGNLGIAGAHVITPGAPEKSVMLQRVRRDDSFRMPQISVNDEPQPVIPFMEKWIRSMAVEERAQR